LSLRENISGFDRIRARLRDAVEGAVEARGILHVEAAHRTVDLPQQARKHFAGPTSTKMITPFSIISRTESSQRTGKVT
jgi:hypothetical protein